MEKVILAILCSIFLTSCSIVETKYIYRTPSFDMPIRPVLRDNDIDDARQIRNLELNYIDVIEYSLKIENILEEIKDKHNQETN